MRSGLYIVADGKENLFSALEPDELSEKHPLWLDDVKHFAPWSKTGIQGSGGKCTTVNAWRSASIVVNSTFLVCGSCFSTMDALRYFIEAFTLSPWDGLIAVEQTQGRGQRGCSWDSPPGNLYVSWYWPDPERLPGAAPGWHFMIPLLAGELTVMVLECLGLKVSIKWPNDLLVNHKKIGGILVENRDGYLVVGIGLNLAFAPEVDAFQDHFAVPASTLHENGISISPLQLWLQLAEEGRSRFNQLVNYLSPKEFVPLLQRRLAWKGEKVIIRKSKGEVFEGVVQGLSPEGGLRINRDGQPETIYTGSILPAGTNLKCSTAEQ